MKYCLQYNRELKITNQPEELIIKYNQNDKSLLYFLEQHKEQRIILFVEFDYDLKMLKALCDKYSNLVIQFNFYNERTIENIVECNFPFFFGDRVSTWDKFLGLIELGVTDIYIVEDLCFELDKVAEIAHAADVQLRTYANVVQSSWKDGEYLKKFFMRPEDVEIYEPYIDVLEFFGKSGQIPTYYKIYKEDKQWFGPLKEIIIGFNMDLDSRYIIPRFAERRVSCGRKCLKGGKCRMCERIKELSHTLEENKIIVTIDKKN